MEGRETGGEGKEGEVGNSKGIKAGGEEGEERKSEKKCGKGEGDSERQREEAHRHFSKS